MPFLGVDEIHAQVQPDILAKPKPEIRFSPREASVALGELDYRQFISCFARSKRENKVAETVIEQVELAPRLAAFLAQRQFDAVADLGNQGRVADLEREAADMRSIVIKLFESRSAEGMGVVDDERATLPGIGVDSGGGRTSGE